MCRIISLLFIFFQLTLSQAQEINHFRTTKSQMSIKLLPILPLSSDAKGTISVLNSAKNTIYQIPQGCNEESCVIKSKHRLQYPQKFIQDTGGNIYVVERNKVDNVKKIPGDCKDVTCVRNLGGNFARIIDVTVDAQENVFLLESTDFTKVLFKRIPKDCYESSCVQTLVNPHEIYHIATNHTGDVYVGGKSQIFKVASDCGEKSCSFIPIVTFPNKFISRMVLDSTGSLHVVHNVMGQSQVIETIPENCRDQSCISTLDAGLNYFILGMTIDGAGNIYFTDLQDNFVKKIPVGCLESSCITRFGGGFNYVHGLDVQQGTIYVADAGNHAINKIPANCHHYSCVEVVANDLPDDIQAVAVDKKGTIYFASVLLYSGKGLYKLEKGCRSSSCMIELGGEFRLLTDIALDQNENLIVIDAWDGAIKKVPSDCTQASCVSTIKIADKLAFGLGIDAVDNISTIDYDAKSIKTIPFNCNDSSCVTTIKTEFKSPMTIGVDAVGNMYLADYETNSINKIPVGCTEQSCISILASFEDKPEALYVARSGEILLKLAGQSYVLKMPVGCTELSCMSMFGRGVLS